MSERCHVSEDCVNLQQRWIWWILAAVCWTFCHIQVLLLLTHPRTETSNPHTVTDLLLLNLQAMNFIYYISIKRWRKYENLLKENSILNCGGAVLMQIRRSRMPYDTCNWPTELLHFAILCTVCVWSSHFWKTFIFKWV